MTEILCRAAFGKLSAIDEQGAEVLRRIGRDEILKVTFTRPRNLGWMRKWWALMQLIASNLDGHYPAETVCELIKIRIGHVTVINTKRGIVEIPKSISFAAMSAAEWADFWDRAVKFICADLMPGLAKADLEREVLEIIGS